MNNKRWWLMKSKHAVKSRISGIEQNPFELFLNDSHQLNSIV
ncbi:hypothetical protein EV08_1072 [Prochlorococcus marinus str. SS2]|nr:hypothetical protein [Prochlorococcus marinus]KGG20487.1 hypothetical protein EV08_1072 [Prochlorococcus marinus str. SS2]